MNDLLQKGIEAYKAGKKDEARNFFSDALKQDLDNEYAWELLYEVSNTEKSKIHCLNQIVRINPKNEKAIQLLEQLHSQPPEDESLLSSKIPQGLESLLSRIYHAVITSNIKPNNTSEITTSHPPIKQGIVINEKKETENPTNDINSVTSTPSEATKHEVPEDIRNILNQLERKASELEENDQWEELILVCLEWLKYSKNNLEALKQLALAYLATGNRDEVEKYCNFALSLLAFNSPDRKPFDRILERVAHGEKLSDSNKKELGIDLGQTWINDAHISKIEKNLSETMNAFDISVTNKICTSCWYEITYSRQYGIPSNGRIEILTPEKIKKLLNIEAVRFIQEGAVAPEVYVRLEFVDKKVGVLKINNDGGTEGFHEKFELFRSIINVIALTYYRDLVVPFYVDVDSQHKNRYTIPKNSATNLSKSTKSISKKFPRHYIPHSNSVYDFQEWHLAQQRARHGVVGHIRWISAGYQADWEKQEQASRAGIKLPIGYTWVIEHERGEQEEKYLILNGTDLFSRTRFFPPIRAENELNKVINSFRL